DLPNGQTLAAVGDGLYLWGVSKGDLISRLADRLDAKTIAWSPDGKLLATGGADASGRLWDVAARMQLPLLTGHTAEVHSLAFTPDGLRFVSGSSDSTARVWDMERKTL